jgi:predicted O-methyltransferase YrrM
MELLGNKDLVHPLAGKCNDILPLLKDNSFDLVFIDADHRMTPFLYDFRQALRLVKQSGIICGDDCDEEYRSEKEAFYQAHCEKDYFDKVHCGVVLGLQREVGFRNISRVENSSFWTYRKKS